MPRIYGDGARNIFSANEIRIGSLDSDSFGASSSQPKLAIRMIVRAVIDPDNARIAIDLHGFCKTSIPGSKITNERLKPSFRFGSRDAVLGLIEKILTVIGDCHVPLPLTVSKTRRFIAASNDAKTRKQDRGADRKAFACACLIPTQFSIPKP